MPLKSNLTIIIHFKKVSIPFNKDLCVILLLYRNLWFFFLNKTQVLAKISKAIKLLYYLIFEIQFYSKISIIINILGWNGHHQCKLAQCSTRSLRESRSNVIFKISLNFLKNVCTWNFLLYILKNKNRCLFDKSF